MADNLRIKDLIKPAAILVREKPFDSIDDLFGAIAALAIAAHSPLSNTGQSDPSADQLQAALINRAKDFPIGARSGILLPHACMASVDKFIGVFIRLRKRQTIGAKDTRDAVVMQVDLIFALLGPMDSRRSDLRHIACVARKFANRELRQDIRSSKNNKEIFQLLAN